MRRFKLASVLNIIGLATAFTACYVLWTQVEFAQNYNKNIPEWENVYRIEAKVSFDDNKVWLCLPRPMDEELTNIPAVESVFAVGWSIPDTKIYIGDRDYKADLNCTDKSGLSALRPKMVCGRATFKTADEILLPQSLAKKIFGDDNPLGKSLKINERMLVVTGVYEDFDQNCFVENCCYHYWERENEGQWTAWNYKTAVRLKSGADPETTAKEINRAFEDKFDGDKATFSLRNIGETYLSGVSPDVDKGDAKTLLVLRFSILFLLLVAAINFANFTLSETPMRIKAINTKKVLGMKNFQLRREFIFETVSVSVLAFLLSIVLIWLIDQSVWMQGLVISSISITDNLHLIIYIGVAAIVIGIMVGIYPAWYSTSFPPAMVLKGSFGLSPHGVVLRKTLVFVQLTVAFVMTTYLGVLFLQSYYIHNSDYGFTKDELLFSEPIFTQRDFDYVRAELEKVSGIEGIGFTSLIPGTRNECTSMWGGEGDRAYKLEVIPVDPKFLNLIGVELSEGNKIAVTDHNRAILSDAAHKKYPWMKIGQIMEGRNYEIVGMAKPFRIFTTRQDMSQICACFLIQEKNNGNWTTYHAVARVAKNVDKLKVKKDLEAALQKMIKVEGISSDFRFFDDQLQTTYEEEFRFIRQVEAFSLICLLITLVGVFCLTMFETEYRRKEIGLRKIMGNCTSDIIKMFCRHYTSLIAIAYILAVPLSYYMAAQWLQNFAERTPIYWWLWAAGLIAVSLVVLFTISVQTWRTARENPINSIKTE